MKETGAEIIAVGTELLLGQITNTNGQWLSNELAAEGINVYYHTVVGDNLQRVEQVFKEAHARAGIIIVCGGLGPTSDDMTREAFQEMTHMNLIEHKPSLDKIRSFYKEKGIEMTPNNIRQARVFKGAHVLTNNTGMAPGMIVSHENRKWIFLPGVPKEMQAMVTDGVLPYLKNEKNEQSLISSEMLHFIGIGESALEHRLRDMVEQQTNPTIAPLAQAAGVGIRITAKAADKDEAAKATKQVKADILERVGAYYIGSDQGGIKEKVYHLLKQKNKNIAAAESLTGGLFADGIISHPGASNVFQGALVCYDTKVKTDVLRVSPQTVAEKGTISSECAMEMAENICDVMDAAIGISFTGNAGPETVEDKPVGTVYIGISDLSAERTVESFQLHGDRESIRRQAVAKGYEMLYKFLLKV